MLFREKRGVNCEIGRKWSKNVCGQNTELGCFMLQQVVHIVPTTEGLEYETINKLAKYLLIFTNLCTFIVIKILHKHSLMQQCSLLHVSILKDHPQGAKFSLLSC